MQGNGNYPAGTWEGDPCAPWNREPPQTCGDCRYWQEVRGAGFCTADVAERGWLGVLFEADPYDGACSVFEEDVVGAMPPERPRDRF